MGKFETHFEHSSSYGRYYNAAAVSGRRKVTGAYRTPPGGSDTVYLLATGLGARHDSMRNAAHAAAEQGFASFALEYSNNSFERRALDANATDIAVALEALGKKHRNVRGIGLSKGGRNLMKGLVWADQTVESATFVASAGVVPWELSWIEGAGRVAATGAEFVGFFKRDPLSAIRMGGSCAINGLTRPLSLGRETNELRHGSEPSLAEIQAMPDRPYTRLTYGALDALVQYREITDTLGYLTFDDLHPYPGGHIDLATGPELANEIYERDIAAFAIQAA